MTYEYGSDSKLLELPNPYQLQNRLLWTCGALLVAAGVVSLLWAKSAIEASAPGLVAAPLVAGILLLAAGRRRSRPRSPPARPAARPPPMRSRKRCARAASRIPSRRARSKACSTTGRRR